MAMTMKDMLLLAIGFPCCITAMVYTFLWIVMGTIEPLAFSPKGIKYRATRTIATSPVPCQQQRIVPIGYADLSMVIVESAGYEQSNVATVTGLCNAEGVRG